jgi:hypothetical protein
LAIQKVQQWQYLNLRCRRVEPMRQRIRSGRARAASRMALDARKRAQLVTKTTEIQKSLVLWFDLGAKGVSCEGMAPQTFGGQLRMPTSCRAGFAGSAPPHYLQHLFQAIICMLSSATVGKHAHNRIPLHLISIAICLNRGRHFSQG